MSKVSIEHWNTEVLTPVIRNKHWALTTVIRVKQWLEIVSIYLALCHDGLFLIDSWHPPIHWLICTHVNSLESDSACYSIHHYHPRSSLFEKEIIFWLKETFQMQICVVISCRAVFNVCTTAVSKWRLNSWIFANFPQKVAGFRMLTLEANWGHILKAVCWGMLRMTLYW